MREGVMNVQVQLQAYPSVDGDRLPLRTPVTVFGKPGLVTGRAFAYERYDVRFADGSVQHSLDRQHLEIDFGVLRQVQGNENDSK